MISPSAAVCPNCAHDHAKDRKDKMNLTQTFLILGLLAVFLLLWKLNLLDDVYQFIRDLIKKD